MYHIFYVLLVVMQPSVVNMNKIYDHETYSEKGEHL